MAQGGTGARLPTAVLVVAGLATIFAVVVSGMSIHLHLRNYRKPALQRMVIRIMVMVPLYGVSSLISLFSLEAAFFIDAVRDIYEAFVIYCFFVLLLSYLGGERQLLIMLHGRPPKDAVFPLNLFKREIDVSDPYIFLFLKRGILQYVQIKPILALTTLILKALGKYDEGNLKASSGYLYTSIVYNASICLSLYCLAVFWMCVSDDLKPFRPVPKFLCVKGILFFSFWQALFISILVSAGVITHIGGYSSTADPDKIAIAITDLLICMEMPLFAVAHAYAFAHTDFIDRTGRVAYVARMPAYYAIRDAFGVRDVVADSRATLRGEGMDYRAFEPSEGFMHQGEGRERRIRAGLRYADGGRRKYWLPRPALESPAREDGYAPLMAQQAADAVHLAPDLARAQAERTQQEPNIWGELDTRVGIDAALEDGEEGYELPFGSPDALGDEELFEHSRQFVFGDYNYPAIDVSSEAARTRMWDEEERVLRNQQSAWFARHPALEPRERPRWAGYGAVGRTDTSRTKRRATPPPQGLVVDYNEGPPPQPGGDEVRMKWTRAQQRGAGSAGTRTPQSAAGSPHAPTHTPPSAPGSASRRNSPLPADAVDLVVETEASTPGVTGLRRVYGSPGEEEAGVMTIGSDGDEDEDEGDDGGYRNIGEAPVMATVVTPPANVHGRHFLSPSGSATGEGDDNPWA